MSNFFKNILSSAIGVILAMFMLIGSILVVVMISSLINLIFNSKDTIKPNSIVKVKMDYAITDKPNNDPFANFTVFGELKPNNSMHLYKILKTIELAAKNDNVAGILLDLREFISPGFASLKDIRDALQNFKKTGKFIYAYSNIYSKKSYYLGSVADSIFMYPSGMMELSGLSRTTTFYTDTYEEIGLKSEIIRHGKFKAAVEPYILTEMSDENREQSQTLLDDVWGTMLKDISESRDITIDSLNKLADNMMISVLPQETIESGLIDQLIYPDNLTHLLHKKINKDKDDKIDFVSLSQLKAKKNKSKNKIAIIYAEGVINGMKNEIHSDYTKTIKKVLENDDINAVVFRVNSPGGSVLISDEILRQMQLSKKEKPIVVSMGDYAASGGYYISCAADKIIASPMTITGSIGVFFRGISAEKLLTKKMKLHYDNVKTNKFSNFLALHRSWSEEEKSFLKTSVKNTYNDFISLVSESRGLDINEVDKIGEGRVWTGLRSVNIGLVDSLGNLNDAIEVAAQLANIETFKVEEFPKTKNGLDGILETIEATKQLKGKNIEEIYLHQLTKKISNTTGMQALLPFQYHID